MKIVVAPNAFKESLTAIEAARAMRRGLRRALPKSRIVEFPVADGGDGVGEVLRRALGGSATRHRVTGPLGEPVQARLIRLGGRGPRTFVIEMAESSGLRLVPAALRNPTRTTTRGLGELIAVAIGRRAERIVIGLGGSATVDGGSGMAQALGFLLLDESGREIGEGGGSLTRLAKIVPPPMPFPPMGVEIVALCDVKNVLLGERGAAAVFGPQKGATPSMVAELETGLAVLANRIQADLNRPVARRRGAGAAGGLGAGLMGFVGASMSPGAEWILGASGFDSVVKGADWVMTGEGRLDVQTLEDKAPAVVASRAALQGVPTVALAGSVDPALRRSRGGRELFASCHSITNGPLTLEEAQARAGELLEEAAFETGRLLGGRVRAR